MLTSKDIKDKAERSYKDFLTSVVKRTAFFPYDIKGNKGSANMPLQTLYPALKNLIEDAKEKKGYGYTLTYREVNTRHAGIITLPDAIFFENIQDYLKYIDHENDFLAFRKAIDLTKKQVPSLLDWIAENPLKCQKYTTEWADILVFAAFFLKNPQPNCYFRQIPIATDLAVLETLKPLLIDILDAILPPLSINAQETDFDNRFGLLTDEPLLHLRFDANTSTFNIENCALPCSFLQRFDAQNIENIYFITDKNVFLSFPIPPLSIAVFWEHTADILQKIAWFSNKNTFFIADINLNMFAELSLMRRFLPKIRPFLMDKNTFETFAQHHETHKNGSNTTFLANLTPEEQDFYTFLLHLTEKNTLRQQNIAHWYLVEKIKKML